MQLWSCINIPNFITHSNALNTKPIYKHYTFNFCVFNLIKRRINIESSFVNTLNYIHTIIADLHLENILDEEDLVEIEKFTANKTIILFIYSLILCIKSGKWTISESHDMITWRYQLYMTLNYNKKFSNYKKTFWLEIKVDYGTHFKMVWRNSAMKEMINSKITWSLCYIASVPVS